MNSHLARQALRIGGSLCLVIFPVLFALVFLLHVERPAELLELRLQHDPYLAAEIMEGLADRAGSQRFYVLPHMLGYLSMPFLIGAAVCLGYILFAAKPWFAIVGAALSCAGAVFMGGMLAMWLSFDALGNVGPADFAGAVPALEALIRMQGPLLWSTILAGLSLLGLIILAIGLLQSRIVPRWTALLILLGSLMMSVFIDVDNLMLLGALLVLAGMTPIAWEFAAGRLRPGGPP